MKLLGKGFRFFDNIRVRYKLLGIYIAVILIPILLVGFYLNYGMREVVLNKTLSETDANVDKLELQLNSVFDRATSISDLIYINKDIETLLRGSYDNNLEIYNAYNAYPVFDDYLKYYDEIENIRFYMTKDMITNSHFVYADHEIRNEAWYKQAIDKGGQISWIYKQDDWEKRNFLTLARAVYDSSDNLLGVLCIYISPGILNEISKNEVYDAYISLDNAVVVHNKNPTMIGIKPSFLAEQANQGEKRNYILDTNYLDEHVKVYVRSFRPKKALDNTIQISAIIPLEEVMREPNTVLFKGFAVIIGCVGVSLSLIFLFIRSFDQRIHILKHAMHKVSKGNFNIRQDMAGHDEIGEVYKELHITMESIKKLINEVYIHEINSEKYKRRQKESEFKMLSSQINPHFLYNTLEMIRMKALINNDLEVANIVKLLSKVMRSSLETTDRPIPLKTEIELVKTYLEIQKLRFGDKIIYSIEMANHLEEYNIFPLLLQPVVENSVIHGLEGKEGLGKININAFETEHHMVLQITDNGLGIPEERLEKVFDQLGQIIEKDATPNRIGLFNVQQRIKLHYGDAYGIKMDSKENEGTTVSLFLPRGKGETRDAQALNYR